MKITRISARNFKGRTFDHQLSPVTVVAGGNFSGKTAILDAIRVGLVGYLPRLGKQASSTWKLAGDGPDMEVALSTDQTTLSHVWRPSKSGASYEGSIPWETPPVLLDPKEYFQQTAAARVEMVFRLSDPKRLGYSDAKVFDRLRAIEVVPTKISRPIVDGVVKDVEAASAARNSAGVQDWLGRQIDTLKARLKDATAQHKFASAKQSAIKPKPRVGGPPKNVSGDLSSVFNRLSELTGRMTASKRAAEAFTAAASRAHSLRAELAGIPEVDKAALEAAGLEIEGLPNADDLASSAKGNVRDARAKCEAANAALLRLQTDLAGIKWPDGLDRCPFCASDSPGWDAHLRADCDVNAAKIRLAITRQKSEILTAEAALTSAKSDMDAALAKDADVARRKTLLATYVSAQTDHMRRRESDRKSVV